jgi:hypothetical protein
VTAFGRWNVSLETPVGARAFVLELRSAQTGVEGTMSDGETSVVLDSARVDGNKVSFTGVVVSAFGRLDLSFAGQAEGDRLVGRCTSLFGEAPFFAHRI